MTDDLVLEILKDIQARLADDETRLQADDLDLLGILNTIQAGLAQIQDRLARIEAKLEGPLAGLA